MPRDRTWERAKKRIRGFARAKNPEMLARLQNPDDSEQEEETLRQSADTLVAIDNPDDAHVHQPETLGIKQERKG